MKENKIIIIGAGLAGSCMANLFANDKHQVEVYEVNNHIGGNLYDYYNDDGVLIHLYGPHIFHTNNDEVWAYVNKYSEFITYTNQVLVSIDNKLVQLPINLNSIKELFNKDFDDFVKEINKNNLNNKSISILELKQQLDNNKSKKIIDYIYDNVYKNYTAKMWGINPNEIDPSVLSRVKINLDYNWNYFPNDKYQAIPKNGYTEWLLKMLDNKNIKIHLNENVLDKISFSNDKVLFNKKQDCVVIYTAKLDELFKYCYGKLDYRSLHIIFETYKMDSYQPTAVVNYPNDPTITRITEYKKLTMQKIDNVTTISKEIPGQFDENSKEFNTPFYPINNKRNNDLKMKYLDLSKKYSNLILVGRLSEYKYYDMDDIIERCLEIYKDFKKTIL